MTSLGDDEGVILFVSPAGTEAEASNSFDSLVEGQVLNIVAQPYDVAGVLNAHPDLRQGPVQATAAPQRPAPEQEEGESEESADADEAAASSTAQEQNAAPSVPLKPVEGIPAYLWESLRGDSRSETALTILGQFDPAKASLGDSFADSALFAQLNDDKRSQLAERILEKQHGLDQSQLRADSLVGDFQAERVNLMKQAVAAATETNEHLKTWKHLAHSVIPLLALSTIAAFIFIWNLFPLVASERMSGWEMAVVIFVLALVAVSPATLLLVGRPLKGLDEWGPGAQEKKAEEAPSKDDGTEGEEAKKKPEKKKPEKKKG